MQLRHSITRLNAFDGQLRQPIAEQTSRSISSAQLVLRAGLGWVCELGITPDMPFYQKKNLALINLASFVSLLLALPGTLLLILIGFDRPFSLLFSGVLAACIVLTLNGTKHVEWAKLIFAYTPSILTLVFTVLQPSSAGGRNQLTYILSRQALSLGLLLPVLIFGFEGRRKAVGVLGSGMLIFLVFEVVSMHLGAFSRENIPGLSHGLFSVFSMLQYMGLAACVLYMQNYTMQNNMQAQRTTEKLHRMAIHDGMTGLFNHPFMEQLIADAINRFKRSHNPLALLMIDVDFFKQINDSLGHNAGDETLKGLASLLNSNTRSTDYLGRWGGDELILLLTDTNLAGAYNLADKLRRLVADHDFSPGAHLTISLGASEYQDGESVADFIARSDAAMYRAKRGGRNRVEMQSSAAGYWQPLTDKVAQIENVGN